MNDDSDAYEFLRDGLLDLLDPDGDLDGDAAEESILLDAVKELHARAERAEAEVARLRAALKWIADQAWGVRYLSAESIERFARAALSPDEGTEVRPINIAAIDAALDAAYGRPDEGTEA